MALLALARIGDRAMEEIVFRIAMNIVVGGCLGRAVVANALGLRTFLNRRRFITLRMGWVERVVTPEPLLLGGVTLWLLVREIDWEDPSRTQAVAAAIGAGFVIVALALIFWAFWSWHGHFFGHGLLPDQHLVTTGAYGFVRHPAYACAILMWVGLGLGNLNAVVLLLAVAYVIPAYVLYMRSEEEMLGEAFGDEYARYREAVPMIAPRLRPRRATAEDPTANLRG
jgi:protein-S-isoprenylcysteine O-methyltransferase Ste14